MQFPENLKETAPAVAQCLPACRNSKYVKFNGELNLRLQYLNNILILVDTEMCPAIRLSEYSFSTDES
jgi:hypothetical protein